MKRYKINKELKKAVRSKNCSLNNFSEILGFEIKNICYKNISINEESLNKLNKTLNTNIKLKEIKFNQIQNLGKYAYTQPIKPISQGEKLAEFIGVMLGDGNIYKNSIRIAFDKRNTAYIYHIENLFENLFGVKTKKYIVFNTNQACLYYYNQALVEKLLGFGLKRGRKIKTCVGIPLWIKNDKKYSKNCIKGLIDTDGCIYKCKREKQTYIKFTNCNTQLLKDFKEVTRSLSYSFARANNKNVCLYRKKEVIKFINDIKPFKLVNGAMV